MIKIIENCPSNKPLKPSIKFDPLIINKKQIDNKKMRNQLFVDIISSRLKIWNFGVSIPKQ